MQRKPIPAYAPGRRMNKKIKTLGLAAGIFAAGILAGYAGFGFYGAGTSRSDAGSTIRMGQRGLINPLLLIKDGSAPFPQLDPLRERLASTIAEIERQGAASDVAVYVRDLRVSEWTGVNENEDFSPASLLKVPILIAYLRATEVNPSLLSDMLSYRGTTDDNVAENIQPLKKLEPGKTYSVDELLGFMIKYSDNNAMDLLISHLGSDAIGKVYSDFDLADPTSTADSMSPKDIAIFFRVLYSSTYLPDAMSEKALELLNYPDFPQGLEAGVPADVPLADKFGERRFVDQASGGTEELHDCGIVYHPERPYLICVMTRGSDFIKLENVLREMSSVTWNYFTSQ